VSELKRFRKVLSRAGFQREIEIVAEHGANTTEGTGAAGARAYALQRQELSGRCRLSWARTAESALLGAPEMSFELGDGGGRAVSEVSRSRSKENSHHEGLHVSQPRNCRAEPQRTGQA
jgi:hypothetical protein